MPTCRNCHRSILFVWDERNKKFVAVQPYEISATERASRSARIPIPYEALKHSKHYPFCTGNNDR